MKKNFLICSVFLLIGGFARAQETEARPEMSAEEKAWTAYMTPGPMHKLLASADGAWEEDITMWLQAGAPPTHSKSTCENTMILGGRYQESVHKGDFNGMPFEGRGLTAWDNDRKVFISTWIDNMGTGLMVLEGTWDEATRQIRLAGKAVDPVSGKEMSVREVLSLTGDDTQKMEMYEVRDGKERKTMEIVLTRRAK